MHTASSPTSTWPTNGPIHRRTSRISNSVPYQRRNIALMRTQAAACVAAHAQYRGDTALFGAATSYDKRYCTQQSCRGRNIVDSTEHAMLKCPSHEPARQAMTTKADAALAAAAAAAPHSSVMAIYLLISSSGLRGPTTPGAAWIPAASRHKQR
jgi:hypothetical protein